MHGAAIILHLGLKELRGLLRDPLLLTFVVFAFTVLIYAAATSTPQGVRQAPITLLDEDQSLLSRRIGDAFRPPDFHFPRTLAAAAAERAMDLGAYTFALEIPAHFERDVLAGRRPSLQLNVDATRMDQAFLGSGYVDAIVATEVAEYLARDRAVATPPVSLALRTRFNPSLQVGWFIAVMELIDHITLLAIVLTGAALLREREHGTVEHLLVMPVTPFQIMAAKVWSMGLAVLVTAALSLVLVIEGVLAVPIAGSVPLFLAGAGLHLFATTSMGIALATFARSMPQFGLWFMLAVMPLQILSGAITPRESMPDVLRTLMLAAPSTHFVALGQAILYRGAGLAIVWPHFASLAAIGLVLFGLALARFRRTLAALA